MYVANHRLFDYDNQRSHYDKGLNRFIVRLKTPTSFQARALRSKFRGNAHNICCVHYVQSAASVIVSEARGDC